jgi:hypothetical protein
VSDIHGSRSGSLAVRDFINEHSPDLLIVCGDITNFGPPSWAREFFDSIHIPIMAVNGNCDTNDVIHMLEKDSERNLMNRHRHFQGLEIVGLQHPLDDSFEFPEKFDILVSHVPPKGCNDSVRVGHIGDAWLKRFVEERGPALLLSGHVHESRGICCLGKTICVNPGPAREGFGALIDIDGDVTPKLVETTAKL